MEDIIGVILAGGKSSRLKGLQKPLISIGGETLIDRAIRKANLQVDKLLLSVNGDILNKLNYNIPIVKDSNFLSVGPLGGVFATLDWISNEFPSAKHIVYFAVDVPFFPDNLVEILLGMKIKDPQKKSVHFHC